MPSCEACKQRHTSCNGDGINPCARCVATGKAETCFYPKRAKAGECAIFPALAISFAS